jgi:SAM-dependent methyltransferase
MTTCRACRSDRLDEVFSMDPMPLAGGFAATAEEARSMPRYPLTWLLCHDCGLVNVSPDIPDDLIYRTYSYAASTVPALVRHHAEFARVLRERYADRDYIELLEIGGNDGVLLKQLPARWDLWNADPSDVALKAALRTDHYGIVPNRFDADDWLGGLFDVVTSSNAFAHFSDIAGALDGVARVLKPGGEFWIEVHSLEATLRTGQWDTIYHEHKAEWSFGSLARNLRLRGLEMVAAAETPLHGGSLRALFVKQDHKSAWAHWEPDGFYFADFRDAYANRKRPPLMAHSAAYGAAARATVYLNQMGTLPIDYVVDGSPLRAGKFVPGLGIPVLSPEVFDQDRPETTLITAWNHAADIRAKHPGYDGWVTAW